MRSMARYPSQSLSHHRCIAIIDKFLLQYIPEKRVADTLYYRDPQ
jgi:hypothetical protein